MVRSRCATRGFAVPSRFTWSTTFRAAPRRSARGNACGGTRDLAVAKRVWPPRRAAVAATSATSQVRGPGGERARARAHVGVGFRTPLPSRPRPALPTRTSSVRRARTASELAHLSIERRSRDRVCISRRVPTLLSKDLLRLEARYSVALAGRLRVPRTPCRVPTPVVPLYPAWCRAPLLVASSPCSCRAGMFVPPRDSSRSRAHDENLDPADVHAPARRTRAARSPEAPELARVARCRALTPTGVVWHQEHTK